MHSNSISMFSKTKEKNIGNKLILKNFKDSKNGMRKYLLLDLFILKHIISNSKIILFCIFYILNIFFCYFYLFLRYVQMIKKWMYAVKHLASFKHWLCSAGLYYGKI